MTNARPRRGPGHPATAFVALVAVFVAACGSAGEGDGARDAGPTTTAARAQPDATAPAGGGTAESTTAPTPPEQSAPPEGSGTDAPPGSRPPRKADGGRPPRVEDGTVPPSLPTSPPTVAGAGPVDVDPPAAPPPGVTPVLVTMFSHNERTLTRFDRFRSDPAEYAAWRSAMIDVVELFDQYGVRYSWQTDYVMLEAIDRFEAAALAGDPDPTGGRPILSWMAEEMGVSLEPHAHECITPPSEGDCRDRPYNYADVAHLLEQVSGLTPAPVIGGTSEAERTVEEFGACIDGNVYDVAWCPTILIGFAGAEGGHTTDDAHSGVWRPSAFDPAGFLEHDPDGPIANVGRGGGSGLFSRTVRTDGEPLDFVLAMVDELASGRAEPGRIYTATLSFNGDGLVDDGVIDDIEAGLAELAPLVAEGRVVYANFPEVIAAWTEWYDAEPNVYDAG